MNSKDLILDKKHDFYNKKNLKRKGIFLWWFHFLCKIVISLQKITINDCQYLVKDKISKTDWNQLIKITKITNDLQLEILNNT